MTVRIVLVNWNGADDTVACLDSLKALTYADVHVTVVDNDSADDSVERIQAAHPRIEVLRTCTNLGFAGGNNVGIRLALEAGDEYVWLLNNDTEVDPDCLTALVRAMEADERLGVAGSKIYYHDRPDTIWFAGGEVLDNGRSRHRGEGEIDEGQYDRQEPTGYATGCSMLVRSAAIAQAGLMSEDYFMYWEEVDWCARIRKTGWGIDYVPASRLWHKIGGSFAGDDSGVWTRVTYDYRNSLYYHWRNDRKSVPRLLWLNHKEIRGWAKANDWPQVNARRAGQMAFLHREKGRIRSADETVPPGVNLFGFITANFGLAVAARNTFWMLRERGVPCCALEVDPGEGRAGKNNEIGVHLRSSQNHFAINVFHISPAELSSMLIHRGDLYPLADRLNVAVPFWELPKIPKAWVPTLKTMDVILAPSKFIMQALHDALPRMRVIHYPQAVFLPSEVEPDRARFGLPEDAFVFMCAFDMHSDIERKNPWAAIDAFERAFPASENAVLAVKVASTTASPRIRELTEALERRAAANPAIRLLTQDLSYDDLMSLYASSDVVVSLHRAEGLGLVPMEAMTLGKPVVATAWSGNMDFMTEENSCLVPYELVPVLAGNQAVYQPKLIGKGQVWAEPDVDAAAAAMVKLAQDPELRDRLGNRAQADMADLRERYRKSEWVDTLMAEVQGPVDPNRPGARELRRLKNRWRVRRYGSWVKQRILRLAKRGA